MRAGRYLRFHNGFIEANVAKVKVGDRWKHHFFLLFSEIPPNFHFLAFMAQLGILLWNGKPKKYAPFFPEIPDRLHAGLTHVFLCNPFPVAFPHFIARLIFLFVNIKQIDCKRILALKTPFFMSTEGLQNGPKWNLLELFGVSIFLKLYDHQSLA